MSGLKVVLDTPEDDGTAMIKETTFSNTQWGRQLEP